MVSFKGNQKVKRKMVEEHEKVYEHGKPREKTVAVQGSVVIATAMLVGALIVAGAVLVASNSITSSLTSCFVAGGTKIQPTQPMATAQPTAQPTEVAGKISVEGRPVRGDPNAQVTIIEFSDFQCPYCGSVAPTIKQVLQEYEGKVKLYYKHFPLSFHEFAQKAAEASECAADQGRFWEYHDKLFENQEALDEASLKQYAKDLGLDSARFDSCLDSGQKASLVQSDFDEGQANGVSGTPAFFINGRMLVGAQPYSAFKQAIDAALAG